MSYVLGKNFKYLEGKLKMVNKFSDSLRESILEEKNKVNINPEIDQENKATKSTKTNEYNEEKNNKAKKTMFEIQEELNQAYTNAFHNVNNDLLGYISSLPTDGDLMEVTKANFAYLQLLQKRKREMISHNSNFCMSLFSIFTPTK